MVDGMKYSVRFKVFEECDENMCIDETFFSSEYRDSTVEFLKMVSTFSKRYKWQRMLLYVVSEGTTYGRGFSRSHASVSRATTGEIQSIIIKTIENINNFEIEYSGDPFARLLYGN